MTDVDLAAHARAIIDANLYLTLGTADPDGRPWTSPVYFAPVGDREFCWVSTTDARHPRHPGAIAAELTSELRDMAGWLKLDAIDVSEPGDLASLLRKARP